MLHLHGPPKLTTLNQVMGNITAYAPLTISEDWSWLWRLFIMALFTWWGTVLNCFFITTFCISYKLKQRGNIFLACLGLSDLIITATVVPSVIMVMISQDRDTRKICHVLQFLTRWSTYAYSVFFMVDGGYCDIYTRLVNGHTFYKKCITYPLGTVAVFNFGITLAAAATGILYDLDYDYCECEHYGNYWFRLVTTLIFYIIPGIVTTYLLVYTACVMKKRVVRLMSYKRHLNAQDKALTNLHLACYTLFVGAWIPYIVLVHLYPDAFDAKYYALIWIALMRSTITRVIYSAMNELVRAAFHEMFVYFCCKGNNPPRPYLNYRRAAAHAQPALPVQNAQPVKPAQPALLIQPAQPENLAEPAPNVVNVDGGGIGAAAEKAPLDEFPAQYIM